jgi:hypothetical protein
MKILFFNPYISRQATQPIQFIMKKKDNDPCNNQQYPCCNKVFSGFGVHPAKLKMRNTKPIRVLFLLHVYQKSGTLSDDKQN